MVYAQTDFTTQFGTGKIKDDGLFYGSGMAFVDNDGNVYVTDSVSQKIQKFSPDGKFLTKWGGPGTNDGQFATPTTMAFDSKGNVYVSDSGNNNIQKFTSNGVFLTKWGGFGGNDGLFSRPGYVIIDSKDNVYVSDNDNRRIQKFSSDGQFIKNWSVQQPGDPEFVMPFALAIDSNDNVYVSDLYRIQKFSSDGKLVSKWATSDTPIGEYPTVVVTAIDSSGNSYWIDIQKNQIVQYSPEGKSSQFISLAETGNQIFPYFGFTFDKNGNLYFFDMMDSTVKKMDTSGKIVGVFGGRVDLSDQLEHPNIVAVDSKDNVYVESTNQIFKFSKDGKILAKLNLVVDGTEITGLTNILFDSFDNMYVSNGQNRIIEFSSDGKFIKEYPIFTASGSYSWPSIGIAMDSKNNLYAFSPGTGVQKFTSDGKLVETFDPQGLDIQSFPAIAIVADNQDNIYVAYQGSHIQKFSSDGKLLTQWGSAGTEKGQFYSISAMAIDSENNLYVATIENYKVIQFSPDGNFISEWGGFGNGQGRFAGIGGIAIDSGDNVYVSDNGNKIIQKFPKDSVFITKAGDNAPISNAGEDQTVLEGTLITLDGTKSSDQDITISNTGIPEEIRFDWKQVTGPFAKLSDNTISSPVVDVPIVDNNVVLSFELTITDYVGLSSTDIVDINVKTKTASDTKFTAPINLSDDDGNSVNAMVATSNNFVYTLWSENISDKMILLVKSSNDFGSSFQGPVTVWQTPYQILNPTIVTSGDNLYVAWIEVIDGTYNTFFVSSNDGAKTFSQPKKFGNSGNYVDVFALKENVYISWTNSDFGSGLFGKLFLEKSEDGGKNFSSKTVFEGQDTISVSQIISTPGKLQIVWNDFSPYGNGTTYYIQSGDGGKTFDSAKTIATNVSSLDSVKPIDDDIYVLLYKQEYVQTPSQGYSFGKVYLLQSNDGGKSFKETPLSDDPAGPDFRIDYVDRNMDVSEGGIYIKITEIDSQTQNVKLYVSSSIDGGKTFNKVFVDDTPQLLIDANSGYILDEQSPFKILSNKKNLYLVYQTPVESGKDIHSFLVKSNDFGQTFEKRTRLGTTLQGYSEFSPRMAISDGWIHLVWNSGKIKTTFPEDSDTFYSRLQINGNDSDSSSTLQSPLKQVKRGVPIDQIECTDSLILQTRYDNTPACVKPDSIPKLIERGWAKS